LVASKKLKDHFVFTYAKFIDACRHDAQRERKGFGSKIASVEDCERVKINGGVISTTRCNKFSTSHSFLKASSPAVCENVSLLLKQVQSGIYTWNR